MTAERDVPQPKTNLTTEARRKIKAGVSGTWFAILKIMRLGRFGNAAIRLKFQIPNTKYQLPLLFFSAPPW
jgi:hypothetical protein